MRDLPRLKPALRRHDLPEALERVQPYFEHGGGVRDRHDLAGAWQLNKLYRIDKHRTLVVAVHVLDIDQIFWTNSGDEGEGPG